jgi:hypothetical protein
MESHRFTGSRSAADLPSEADASPSLMRTPMRPATSAPDGPLPSWSLDHSMPRSLSGELAAIAVGTPPAPAPGVSSPADAPTPPMETVLADDRRAATRRMAWVPAQRIHGMLLGQAHADAMAVGTQGMTHSDVQHAYPSVPFAINDIAVPGVVQGCWSACTDVSIVLLDAALRCLPSKAGLGVDEFADRVAEEFAVSLLAWRKRGLVDGPDNRALGVSDMMARVVADDTFAASPFVSALKHKLGANSELDRSVEH